MNDPIAALILGIIEGLTEFLPISSTGHLLIAQHWLGARSDLFNIAIQSGAILAVSLVYRQRLWALALGWREPLQRDYLGKLLLAFLVTAVLGLIVKLAGVELPATVWPVALALVVGGVLILLIERRVPGGSTDSQPIDAALAISWRVAMIVGAAQVVAAIFPGTSRSAAAIFAALLMGVASRPAATEFAFLVGIPTMFAATGFELLRYALRGGGEEAWGDLAIAFVASTVVGFLAVRWLLGYIKAHRFTLFGWYRIALGVGLLAWLGMG